MSSTGRRPSRRGRVLGIGVLLLAVPVVLLLIGGTMGWFGSLARSLVFFPDTSTPPPAAQVVPGGRDVHLHTDDGLTLDAWLLPPSGTDRDVAVIYLPGNGANRVGRVPLQRELTERGFTVLAVDYRGYGGNPGTPSEEGLASDARAAAAFLRQEGFTRTLYLGESVGTGVTVRLAQTDPPDGILLRSPFTSLTDVGTRHYPYLPVARVLEDRFDVLDRMPDLPMPITVISGDADDIVPADLSAQVAAATPHLFENIVERGAGHNDAVMFGPLVADALVRLADEAVPGAAQS